MIESNLLKPAALVGAAALLLTFGTAESANAAYLSNGDFESLDSGNPPFAGWNETTGVTDHTTDPIGGAHSARFAGGQAQQLANDPNGDLTHWRLDFDLAVSDGGAGEDRAFQLYLQQDANASRINLRVTDQDNDGDGDLWAYNQVASSGTTGWKLLISDAVVFSAADNALQVNHVQIVGDYASAVPSFDVHVTDASGALRSSLGNAYFQYNSPVAGTTLDDVVYQAGSLATGAWFVADNTVLALVPEPASLGLIAVGGLLMLRGRNR